MKIGLKKITPSFSLFTCCPSFFFFFFTNIYWASSQFPSMNMNAGKTSWRRQTTCSPDILGKVVQSFSCVRLFAIPWTAAHQASLSFTISQSLLKLMPIESVMLSISSSVAPFSCPQPFPASGSFPMSWLFRSGGQSIRVSILVSVLLMSIHGWFPLRLPGFISLLSKGCSRVFSSTTVVSVFHIMPWHRVLWTHTHTHTGVAPFLDSKLLI